MFKIHATAKRFLINLAEHAADRRQISANVLYNYDLKMLSMCLVKRIGYMITTETNAIKTNRNTNVTKILRQQQERTFDTIGLSAD